MRGARWWGQMEALWERRGLCTCGTVVRDHELPADAAAQGAYSSRPLPGGAQRRQLAIVQYRLPACLIPTREVVASDHCVIVITAILESVDLNAQTIFYVLNFPLHGHRLRCLVYVFSLHDIFDPIAYTGRLLR